MTTNNSKYLFSSSLSTPCNFWFCAWWKNIYIWVIFLFQKYSKFLRHFIGAFCGTQTLKLFGVSFLKFWSVLQKQCCVLNSILKSSIFIFLKDLKLAGLDYLNISLDTLQEKKYGFVTRRPSNGFHRVMQAIDKSIDLGNTKIE